MKTSEERIQHILEKTKKQEALKRRKRVKWISIASGTLSLILVFVFSFTLFNPSMWNDSIADGNPPSAEFPSGQVPPSGNNDQEPGDNLPGRDEQPGTNIPGHTPSATPAPDFTGNPYDYTLLAKKIDEIQRRSDSGNTNQDSNGGSGDASLGGSEGTGPAGDRYVEVTNNQVSGIVEADGFKRSNNYIFYLCHGFGKDRYENGGWVDIIAPYYFLRVYSIAGKNSALVSEFNIPAAEGFRYDFYSFNMYLSQDCSTITIIAGCRDVEQGFPAVYYTEIIGIDVSNPHAPKEIGRSYVSGSYNSSRMVGDTLLLATDFTVKYNCDFENPEDYVPQIGDSKQRSLLTMEDIYVPENANTAKYTVLASINAKTLAFNDVSALFSYTSDLYVSENYLFATCTADADTEIAFFDYNEDSLNFCGMVATKGTIVNQYSIDESDNILRVFTTSLNANGQHECNLYCFDLDTFELIASVENFSDHDEQVMSVRFDGNTAYVCTAIFIQYIVDDPVFEFDLSDYDNITWKDTGTIPGYSLSLVGFTDGTLLGFGYNDSEDTLKLELYRTVADSVESVAAYIAPNTTFPDDFKAYFIDAENGLIGLGIKYEYERFRYVDQYLLLRYDAETQSIEVLYTFELFSDGYPNDSTVVKYGGHTYTATLRGCFIDGYFYLIGQHDFQILEF